MNELANIDAPDKVVALMADFPTQSEPASGLERGAINLSERLTGSSGGPLFWDRSGASGASGRRLASKIGG